MTSVTEWRPCHTTHKTMPTIRKRGSRYQAQVRIKKRGVIVHEESATFDTERQAMLWGCGIEESFDHDKARPTKSTALLADVIDTHRESLKSAKKDLRGVAHVLASLSDSKLGRMEILKIQAGDVIAWARRYAQDDDLPRTPATVLNALMNLRSVYATARTELNIKTDVQEVADAIKQLKRLGLAAKSIERDRRVTDEEVDALASWHESLNETTIPLRTILNLAIALPRRRGELLNDMRWEHYTGDTVKLFDTKDPTGARNEVVPIPPNARKIIDSLPRSKMGFILPYNPASVSSAVFKGCRMLGIEDLHFHDLRHEGISRLFESGLDIPRVSMISGHKSWATLRRYTHLSPADVVARMVELA